MNGGTKEVQDMVTLLELAFLDVVTVGPVNRHVK
jgi:hypothetical protein